jgi:hypothetical protein
MRELVEDLRGAVFRDPDPWDVTLYERAADEIERLRAQVAELLPFALADAELGADLGPHPGGEYDECGDCRWQLDSTALLRRIAAGEFGPPPDDTPSGGAAA